MIELNDEQKTAAEIDAPLIVVNACPGSGKTATLVQRVKRDLEKGTPANQVGVFTFTVAAAREFEERLQAIGVTGLGYIGTLHGWCLKHAIKTGAAKRCIDDDEHKALIDQALSRLRYRDGLAAKIKSALIEGRKLTGKSSIAEKSIKREMEKAGVVAMNQLVDLGTRMLRKQEAPAFAAIYVDEYQDASDGDHRCYRAMKSGRFFLVGDADQAIYGFRGSNHRNLEITGELAEDYGANLTLTTNYRSERKIVNYANRIAARIVDRKEKEMQPRPEARSGQVFLGGVFETAAEECEAVGRDIETCIGAGIDPGEIAILVRYNAEAIRIAQALKMGRNLPVALAGKIDDRTKRTVEAGVALIANPCATTHENWTKVSGRDCGGFDPLEAGQGNLMNAMRLTGIDGGIAREIATLAQTADRCETWSRSPESAQLLREAAQEAIRGKTEKGKIQVLTLHGSKGLEWDQVYIMHADNQAHPPNAEATRLAFVGVTRARMALTVSYSRSKPDFIGRMQSGLELSSIFK